MLPDVVLMEIVHFRLYNHSVTQVNFALFDGRDIIFCDEETDLGRGVSTRFPTEVEACYQILSLLAPLPFALLR